MFTNLPWCLILFPIFLLSKSPSSRTKISTTTNLYSFTTLLKICFKFNFNPPPEYSPVTTKIRSITHPPPSFHLVPYFESSFVFWINLIQTNNFYVKPTPSTFAFFMLCINRNFNTNLIRMLGWVGVRWGV
jgi:hypothetical protein